MWYALDCAIRSCDTHRAMQMSHCQRTFTLYFYNAEMILSSLIIDDYRRFNPVYSLYSAFFYYFLVFLTIRSFAVLNSFE